MTDEELIEAARALAGKRSLSKTVDVASVGCALLTARGSVFTGVNIDAACSIGFCAEHAAIAAMVTAGESRIETIVAVGDEGRGVLSPCGRCRELVWQTDPGNRATRVVMPGGRAALLSELLPHHWKD